MDNSQRVKLNTGNRVKEFNAKHAGILSTIPEYALEIAVITEALVLINNAAQIQSETVATASNALQITKEKMANVSIKYALRGMVKAKQMGNLMLATQLDHRISYISKASKTISIST